MDEIPAEDEEPSAILQKGKNANKDEIKKMTELEKGREIEATNKTEDKHPKT